MSNDFISGFLLAWMMAALWWLGMFVWMWFHRDRPLEPATKNEPDSEPPDLDEEWALGDPLFTISHGDDEVPALDEVQGSFVNEYRVYHGKVPISMERWEDEHPNG